MKYFLLLSSVTWNIFSCYYQQYEVFSLVTISNTFSLDRFQLTVLVIIDEINNLENVHIFRQCMKTLKLMHFLFCCIMGEDESRLCGKQCVLSDIIIAYKINSTHVLLLIMIYNNDDRELMMLTTTIGRKKMMLNDAPHDYVHKRLAWSISLWN